MRTPPHGPGPALTAATVVILLLAGCSGGDADPQAAPTATAGATDTPRPDGQPDDGDGDGSTEADSVTSSEPFAAIPTDGSPPGDQLDIGGPGLGETCASAAMPVPVDATNVACTEHDGAPAGPDDPWGGSVDDRLEPGTYWAVLVCDDVEGVEIKFDTAPGLPSTATEIACADGTGAARVELGSIEAEATSDWGVRATGTTPGTFLFYLVREGQTA